MSGNRRELQGIAGNRFPAAPTEAVLLELDAGDQSLVLETFPQAHRRQFVHDSLFLKWLFPGGGNRSGSSESPF